MMEDMRNEKDQLCDFDKDMDPDINFHNKFNDNCKYFSEDEVNIHINSVVKSAEIMSYIHFNIRSIYANFNKLKEYLTSMTYKFKLVALSETWLDKDRDEEFEIEGYKQYHINREGKRGGGVALYVDNGLRSKLVKEMSVAIEGVLECVAVEIEMCESRNVIPACIYKAQGSTANQFTDSLEILLDTQNHHKTLLMGGDFNIDFLNPNNCRDTSYFLDTLTARSLLPVITQPSRITSSSATLIDNIITNNVGAVVQSGLLYNDISDHLPVLTIFDLHPLKTKIQKQLNCYRQRTELTVNEFRKSLFQQDWSKVYVTDVNVAHESFLGIYISLYNKCCPLKLFKETSKLTKPWMTRGLTKACRKKNKLYTDFMKNHTVNNEMKYKTYKNKLTTILRKAKIDYYNGKLIEQKGNMKATWKILNEAIHPDLQKPKLPDYFVNNDLVINNSKEVANQFNNFFVKDTILQSMFVGDVDESEILATVKKSEKKKIIY
ncbi:transcription factor CP2-like protein 1 isoform X1 [Oryzias melastigma]|uniref:transcription factor CP2-like protein 1 isoform X1 n=1 Tax=Oryzias melastigma TaxID=30732 RepID=UPI000CF813EE|nr:transcription factor CP2-like protein 1 isoform X1 [Oryzias melastigma]XP_024141863.1 transcription factor CP2-like protein 1 isoform X1 [Oryzias melastigma]XP_036065470.1 transcription factor CP2-like protein 1 isoform X1 [Oryzias melastigma]